jgi:hypothetical protein
MDPMQPPHKRLRLTFPALATALVALCLAGSASAASPFDSAAPMNLVFTKASATLVGSEALVPVRCEGPRSGLCNGTAVLRVRGKKHEIPFAVSGGTRSSLAVTVGSAGDLRGQRAVALAKTAQQGGGYLRAREVLRLKLR